MPLIDDSLARVYVPPIRPQSRPVVAGDPSPAGVLDSGRDRVTPLTDTSESVPGYSEGASVSVVGTNGTLKGAVSHSGGHPGGYPTELRTLDGGVTTKLNSSGLEVSHAAYKLTFNPSTGVLDLTRVSNGKNVSVNLSALANDVVINGDGVTLTNAASNNYVRFTANAQLEVHNPTNNKSIVIDPTLLANTITIDANGIKVLNAVSNNYTRIAADGVITVYDASGLKTLTIDPESVTRDMSIREIDICDGGVAKKMLILASLPY